MQNTISEHTTRRTQKQMDYCSRRPHRVPLVSARNKAQIISDWFLERDNEFTIFKWPSQSPDLNPIQYIWDVVEREIHIMDVQPTNLQQLRNAIMLIWTKISEECLQHLVESMPQKIKVVLKAKEVQPDTS